MKITIDGYTGQSNTLKNVLRVCHERIAADGFISKLVITDRPIKIKIEVTNVKS